MYDFNFAPVFAAMDQLLIGAWVTVKLSAAAMAIGLIVSIACAIAKTSGPRPLRLIVDAYIEAIRNTPFLVQISSSTSACRPSACGSTPTPPRSSRLWSTSGPTGPRSSAPASS